MARTLLAFDMDLFKWALRRKRMTHAMLAAALEADPAEISRFATGKLPSPWARAAIARLLGVDVHKLYRPLVVDDAEEDLFSTTT